MLDFLDLWAILEIIKNYDMNYFFNFKCRFKNCYRHNKLIKMCDKSAIRASGLIPVFPFTTINKDTQLPMCIEEQAINY